MKNWTKTKKYFNFFLRNPRFYKSDFENHSLEIIFTVNNSLPTYRSSKYLSIIKMFNITFALHYFVRLHVLVKCFFFNSYWSRQVIKLNNNNKTQIA